MDDQGFIGTQSGIGQGLAYLLPSSRTGAFAIQLANEKAAQIRQDQILAEKQRQAENDTYAKHLYESKTPQFATEYSKYIQPQFDELAKFGADYHQTTGKDPYANPAFIQKRNDLISAAQQTTQAHQNYIAANTALRDKGATLDEKSKAALQTYVSEYEKNPLSKLNTNLPSVEQRPLGFDDAAKLMAPVSLTNNNGAIETVVPNRSSHVIQARAITSDPKFAPYLQSKGINTQVGDVFGVPNGKGGTVYPTDGAAVAEIANHFVQNKDNPALAATIQAAGIQPDDPFIQEKMQALVLKQNKGYGNVYSQLADYADAKVKPVNKSVFTGDNNRMAHARLSLEQQRLNKEKSAADDGRDEFINDFTSGSTEARNKVIKAANAVGGHYSPSKDGFTITIPKSKAEAEPEIDEDPNSENFGQPILDANGSPKMKKVVGDLTFTVPYEKTEAAKTVANSLLNHLDLFKKRPLYDKKDNKYQSGGHPEASVRQSIKSADIATKASAAGYSVKEYTDLLRKNGVEIQESGRRHASEFGL